ncbi:MAG: hypothetical protein U9R75_01555 [Candidatus Thermoplasmatota archaeon]|nr:hypothetical protein [Candidatus Thermoplasmatota archaeon]
MDSVHIYLETADEILNKINERDDNKASITLKTFEYGKIAALLKIDEELRFRKIDIDPEGLVLVFDKGNNSAKNIRKVSERINVLGSLKKKQVKDLFKALSRYKPLYTTDKGVEISGFSTKL